MIYLSEFFKKHQYDQDEVMIDMVIGPSENSKDPDNPLYRVWMILPDDPSTSVERDIETFDDLMNAIRDFVDDMKL